MNIKVNVALVKNQRVKGSATVVFDDCFIRSAFNGHRICAMGEKIMANGCVAFFDINAVSMSDTADVVDVAMMNADFTVFNDHAAAGKTG